MSNTGFDVIVIGEGITGLTAARHTSEHGLLTAMFEAKLFGGLIIGINKLDGVAEEESGSGADLVSRLMMENLELGVANHNETVTGIARDGDLLAIATDGNRYRAKSVIIASGARLKRLGIPGEAKFEHRGVSQCADCDGPMLKGADAVVVGGGDSALQEALVLANFCERVHLVHRGSKFHARQHLAEAVDRCTHMKLIWNTVVDQVIGTEGVTAVGTRNLADGTSSEIPCRGFFAYVGLEPNSDFLPPEIKRDAQGHIVTGVAFATTLPGVFAAGAVRAGYGGMIADAIAEAKAVAAAASAYLGKK